MSMSTKAAEIPSPKDPLVLPTPLRPPKLKGLLTTLQ